MTKMMTKMIAVILMAVLAVSVLSQVALATQDDDYDLDMFDNAEYENTGAEESITSIIASIITIVQIVGTGVAIIMLIVLAIKYISAAPGDKADIKKHAVVYVVGAVVLFAATGILEIIKNFSKNVSSSQSNNGGGNG